MDTLGAFYAITLHSPELPQTIQHGRERRGAELAPRLGRAVRRGLGRTLHALAALVTAPPGMSESRGKQRLDLSRPGALIG